ncbi:MAG: geranylgeranyl reductase family protein [bacterium]|nr:geranylgeranyl reductase family protein [bacterium]
MNDKKKYDVIISGAGPAGCASAFFLTQAGLRVLLLDKATFPREKICGDGVAPAALDVIDRMGMLEKVEACGNTKVNYLNISSPAGHLARSKFPSIDGSRDYGIIFPRKEFDALMVDTIANLPGVEFMDSSTVKGLVFDNNNKPIGVSVKQGNKKTEYYGKYIIAADGAYSPIARNLSLYNNIPKYRAFSVRAYFENVTGLDTSINLHFDKYVLPGYGWVFPVKGGRANVGVIIYNRYTPSPGIKGLFNRFINENPYTREKLKNAKMVKDSLMGYPLTNGSFPSRRAVNNVLLTGDAGSFIDALTGEGIYYALRTGEFASQAIIAEVKEGRNAAACYEKLWKKELKWKEYMAGYLIQGIFNHPGLVDFYMKRAQKKPAIAETMAGVLCHIYPKRKIIF